MPQRLRAQVQLPHQQQEQSAAPSNQLQALQLERDRATNALAALAAENAALKTNPNPVLKLRGEVSRLRRENAEIGSTNALSKVTSNPEMRKLLRDQQKTGMAMIYKAYDPSLDRLVAIKQIAPHLAQDERFIERGLPGGHAADHAVAVAHVVAPHGVAVHGGLVERGQVQPGHGVAQQRPPDGVASSAATCTDKNVAGAGRAASRRASSRRQK